MAARAERPLYELPFGWASRSTERPHGSGESGAAFRVLCSSAVGGDERETALTLYIIRPAAGSQAPMEIKVAR